jgi:hypothetical protein
MTTAWPVDLPLFADVDASASDTSETPTADLIPLTVIFLPARESASGK